MAVFMFFGYFYVPKLKSATNTHYRDLSMVINNIVYNTTLTLSMMRNKILYKQWISPGNIGMGGWVKNSYKIISRAPCDNVGCCYKAMYVSES